MAPATAAAPAKAASAAKAPAVAPAFYAQAGAYTRADDAEAQRAKLALLGLDAKVSEREQAGRTVYRVRAGPFETRAQVEAVIERLQGAGVEAALVRVERQ
jgi:cell division protein FtsN